MKATIGLAISTLNDGIFRISELCKANADEILVLHQVTIAEQMEKYAAYYAEISNDKVKIFTRYEKGLSHSRNQCLQLGETTYMLVCDDDILLDKNCIEHLRQAIADYPSAAVIAGRMLKTEDQFYKEYNANAFRMHLRSAAKVSSCEMLLNRKWLLENDIQFDAEFGLGSKYPGGEEFILLADIINKKGIVQFVPINFCMHTESGSGNNFTREMIIAKGAMIRRVYGWQFIVINLLFSLRKYTAYKNNISFLQFIRYIYAGSLNYS